MATTPRGYPKFSLTDNADIAAKLDALADAVDGDVTNVATVAAYTRRVQTAGFNVASDNAWHTVTAWTGVEGTGAILYGSGIFTLPTPGHYWVIGKIAYQPVTSPIGFRGVRLYLNTTLLWESAVRPDATYNVHLPFSWGGRVAANDTLHVETVQTQGSTQSLATVDGMNTISIARTGA